MKPRISGRSPDSFSDTAKWCLTPFYAKAPLQVSLLHGIWGVIILDGNGFRAGSHARSDPADPSEQGVSHVGDPPYSPELPGGEICLRNRGRSQRIHRRAGRVRQAGFLRSAPGIHGAHARRAAPAEAQRILPHRRRGRCHPGGSAQGRVQADVRAARGSPGARCRTTHSHRGRQVGTERSRTHCRTGPGVKPGWIFRNAALAGGANRYPSQPRLDTGIEAALGTRSFPPSGR